MSAPSGPHPHGIRITRGGPQGTDVNLSPNPDGTAMLTVRRCGPGFPGIGTAILTVESLRVLSRACADLADALDVTAAVSEARQRAAAKG